jgi:hypothetical protein
MNELLAGKLPSTGVDSLLQETEPDDSTQVCKSSNSISLLTVTQPLSVDEELENMEKRAMQMLDLLRSQRAHMDPDWIAKFSEAAEPLFKVMDETCHMLPKTE